MALKGFMELLRLDGLAKSRTNTPTQVQEADWKGVAFTIAEDSFVTPLGEIAEVLPMPSVFTPMPLTQSWMIGVANVRGDLLPLTDLAKFLGINSNAEQLAHRKVLVIKRKDMMFGIIVDSVSSIKTFSRQQYVAKSPPENSPILPYSHGQFAQDEQIWPIFIPSLLTKDPRFIDASL